MDDFTLSALHAHLQAYYALVRALHEEGVLPISAVVNRMGDRIDAGQTAFRDEANPIAQTIYEGLLQLEQQYAQAGTAPPFPTDKG